MYCLITCLNYSHVVDWGASSGKVMLKQPDRPSVVREKFYVTPLWERRQLFSPLQWVS